MSNKSLPLLPAQEAAIPILVVTVDNDACPGPTIRHFDPFAADSQTSRMKLPPFQQSKRWAKRYSSAAKHTISITKLQPVASEPVEQASDVANSPTQVTHESAGLVDNDSSSIHGSRGLCRPASLPGWQFMKKTCHARSTSMSALAPAKSPSMRHTRKVSHDRVAWMKGPRVALPKSVRNRRKIRTKRGFEDLREVAGTTGQNPEMEETVVNLDRVEANILGAPRPNSPVPSLHDAEKDRRFSQECEALLGQVDFGHDWSFGAGQQSKDINKLLGTPALPRQVEVSSTNDKDAQGEHKLGSQSTRVQGTGPETGKGNSATVTPEKPSRPDLPTRISSLDAVKAKPKPLLRRQNNVGTPHNQKQPHETNASAETASRKSRLLGMSCSWSGLCLPITSKASDAAASTDTLTVIEAQVMNAPPSAVVEKLREKTAFIIQSPRARRRSAARLSGVGLPPERPLPKLPQWADQVMHQQVTDETSSPSKTGSTARHAVLQTIREVRPTLTDVSDTSTTTDTEGSGVSVSNHDGARNIASFGKASRGGLRQRGDLKRRHMNQHYAGSIEEHDTTTSMSGARQLEVPELKEQASFSELDKFPAVPTSRPSSRASTTAARTRTHVRQSSFASSSRRRPGSLASRSKAEKPEPQALRRSNIMVLVDTNPTTATFRAGAMSPEPSVESRNSSPTKSVHSVGIFESSHARTGAPRPKRSLRSLRSQGSGRSSANTKKARARISPIIIDGTLSSDEEYQPLVTRPRKISTSRQRRARPSHGDEQSREQLQEEMHKVQRLLDEQYDLILRQEQRLRQQAEEIQMMRRIIAPMPRVRTLDIITDEDEEEEKMVEPTEMMAMKQSATHVPRKWTETVRPSSATSSRASATSDMNLDTDTAGSRSASLTDPTEYDIPDTIPKHKDVEVASSSSGSSSKSRSGITVKVNGKERALREPPPIAASVSRNSVDSPRFIPIEVAAIDTTKEVKRLSVNHVLTNTEQMDRAIDALRAYG